MNHFDRFALQRPELTAALVRGEEKICALIGRSLRTLPAGEELVSAGEDHRFVYRLRRGWAGRVRFLPDGRAQFILLFLPGDIFAVKSMFVREHPDAIEALSDVVVEQIDHAALRAAYEKDSDIAMRCTWQVIDEERRLHNWVVSLGRGGVSERLAVLLLNMRGRLALAGAIGSSTWTFEIPMTQQQLADYLGLSLVHVNKNLMKLREAGMIAVRGREFTILDVDALARKAEPLLDSFEASRPEFVGQRYAARKVAS
ncbi:Crp/Fnr family transcriptional regulator [Labrys monachus]|uniref:CRP-like cAMP-binding protein n=1 Tax=Labrys monachus TaxID=217067 RepID=A0ABU0F9T3_9HYPH|nr:Crp/Fnr family transcriptional regulator [Labrys monachus]MDQ0391374.1 CRP-like cAMP-binding protein [Labrys monachus]